jgi:hypothetical protein
MSRLLTGFALLLAAGAASGQMVECIDAKGNRTFAQFCPPSTVKENKLMKGGASMGGATPPPAAATPGKSLAERDAEFKKRAASRQEAEAKAEKEKAEAKDDDRSCQDARAHLRALQDGQRIARVDPKTGERIVLDDKDRPGEIANAQKSVDQWCNRK